MALVVGVLANLAFWAAIFFLQKIDSRLGRIPPRKKWDNLFPSSGIPYLQDYWTNGPVGDLIALSFVDAAVVHALAREGTASWMLLVLAAGAASAFVFFTMATRPERAEMNIDWWFWYQPVAAKVKILPSGWLHLAYFWLQSSSGLLLLWFLLQGQLESLEVILGAMGCLIYAVAFAADKKQGHI